MRANVGYSDREGRFLYATPALATSIGMTPKELIGRTWYEIGVPPEVVRRLEAARQHVLETGRPARRRARFHGDGGDRETQFLIKPVVAADGSIAGTMVTAWDTDLREHERPRHARLDRTYAVLSAIAQVIVRTRDRNVLLGEACRITAEIGGFELAWVGLVDPATGDVRMVCQAGRDEGLLSGLTISVRDEPSGHGVVGTSIRENRSVIVQDIRHDARMDAWRSFFDELGYQTAAGFPLKVLGRPIGTLAMYTTERGHFDADEARLFEQLAEDISGAITSIEVEREQALARAALEASERRYRDVFDLSPHPMGVYDVETARLLAVNHATVQDYGYSRDELLAMRLTDLVWAGDVPALLEEMRAAAPGTGSRSSGPWRLVRKDGTLLEAEVSTRTLDFDGRPARLVLAIDVTQRRRLEAKVAETTRLEAMGHLAAGIAHDFNNLLTAVNGYADILVGELEGDERADAAVEIRRAGARAAELTKQVLTFARRQAFVPRPVDLNAVVGAVGGMLRRLIGEHIHLITTLDALPVVVRVDPSQLEQVLVNLALNSRDAMPQGGVLEISVARVEDARDLGQGMTGPAALLAVTDTGFGMDAGTLHRAFEPFFTTKEPGRGTGLGLATVYGIVQQSDGRIWAESTAGRGTRVLVLLPLVDADPEPLPASPATAQPACDGGTILLVEDDPAVRAFTVTRLERAGHRVLVASSAAQARALSGGLTDPIDVLLTDLVMPDGNGRDLARLLLAERPSIGVVLMSGYDDGLGESGERSEFRFLAKPFGANGLIEAVERTLRDGQPRRTARGSDPETPAG